MNNSAKLFQYYSLVAYGCTTNWTPNSNYLKTFMKNSPNDEIDMQTTKHRKSAERKQVVLPWKTKAFWNYFARKWEYYCSKMNVICTSAEHAIFPFGLDFKIVLSSFMFSNYFVQAMARVHTHEKYLTENITIELKIRKIPGLFSEISIIRHGNVVLCIHICFT